jgi:hypothetical protein
VNQAARLFQRGDDLVLVRFVGGENLATDRRSGDVGIGNLDKRVEVLEYLAQSALLAYAEGVVLLNDPFQ